MSSTSLALSPSVRPPRSARIWTGLRARAALAVTAAAFAVSWAGLITTHSAPHLAVPKPVALQHVLADPVTARTLRTLAWTHVDVIPVDPRLETLAFDRGDRVLATVDVGFNGHVVVLDTQNLTLQKYANGSGLAHDHRLLALLAFVFLLMSAVWPLWRLRNLDVLVVTGSVASIVLLDQWRPSEMVLASYPILFYLGLRCAWRALGPQREPRPAIPLYEQLTRRWATSQRLRALRLGALASALIVAMVGLTSLHVLDVGIAVMEGATAIVHGLLPYGHIPDVFHGDTYPFGSYLLYAPFAWLWPVRNGWDNVDVTLAIATAAALLAGWGLFRISGRPGGDSGARRRSYEHESAGLRSAIAWMTFPPLVITVSAGTTDVALAAMLVGALVLWRRPRISTALLSLAGWFKLVPAALLPLWLARFRGAGLRRGLAAIAIVSVPMVALLLALGGLDAPGRMINAMSFQFTREAPTLWALIGSVPLQQLAQAATLALIAGATVRLRSDSALAHDRGRFAALCGAVLLGLQISGNYWSYMYLVWVLPFLAVSVLESASPRAPSTLRA